MLSKRLEDLCMQLTNGTNCRQCLCLARCATTMQPALYWHLRHNSVLLYVNEGKAAVFIGCYLFDVKLANNDWLTTVNRI